MTYPALRATARIAWGQVKRARGRSALVLAMIALPIAALTLGATLIRTSVPTKEENVIRTMGTAELRLFTGTDANTDSLQQVLPHGSRVVVIGQWNRTLVVGGSLVYATAWEPSIPIDQAPLPGLYEMMRGRVPRLAGEAAVDPRVLEIFDVEIGDDVTIADRTFRVVGVAAHPAQMWDPLLVVAPGTLGPREVARSKPSSVHDAGSEYFVNSVLIDLPDGTNIGEVRAAIIGWLQANAGSAEEADAIAHSGAYDSIQTRNDSAVYFVDDATKLTGVSFGGATFVLFATGLISAAAFAVGIRRQLRMLGLVGASGGEPAHVRSVVLLSGTSLGILGSGLGVLAGIGAAYLVTPYLPRITHAFPGDVLLPWPMIAGAALLGVIAATVAATWPARMASRISTLDSLASRMPPPRPPGRLARWGLGGVAAGLLLTATSARPGGNEQVVAAGLGLTLAGFLVTIPLLVQIAGRHSTRLPAASHVAFRETARNSRRAGVAVAAAGLALTLPVAVAALSLSEEEFQRRQDWMAPNHLLIGEASEFKTSEVDNGPAASAITEIKALLPGSIAVSPRSAAIDLKRYPPPKDFGEIKDMSAYVDGPFIETDGGGRYRRSELLFIGGRDLLLALNAGDGIAALETGKIVGIGPDTTDEGFVYLRTPELAFATGDLPGSEFAPLGPKFPAVEAGTSRYELEEIPMYVVSPAAAERMGLLAGQFASGTLVAAADPLTPEQIEAVKAVAAARSQTYVRTVEDFLPDFGRARSAAIAASSLIALGIVAVIVALVASEARRDQAILVAVGAAPGTRRRIAGARAGLIALLAALIAVPAGFVPVTVIQWARRFPIVLPWPTMLLVGVAVPVVAALFGWATSRTPKAKAMVQPVY